MTPSLAVHRSRKLVPEFVLHRPQTVTDACELLYRYKGSAAVLAGGIDVISRMKFGVGPVHMVAITGIAEMRSIRRHDDCLQIGAAATHRELETDALLQSTMPALADYIGGLGNIRVRCQGTIGGNLMADEAGYEILPLLLVLDAVLNFCDVAKAASYTVSARNFVRRGEAAQPVDLLTSISIPLPPAKLVWNRDLRPTLALVAGVRDGNGSPAAVAAALVGAHRRAAWGPVSLGARLDATTAAARWAAALPHPDLLRAPGPIYARRVGAVMLRRALTDSGLAA
jgi:carbon-monoxide dehydrogenase medium subunit